MDKLERKLALGIMLLLFSRLYVNLIGIDTAQVTNYITVVEVAPYPTKMGWSSVNSQVSLLELRTKEERMKISALLFPTIL